MAILYRTIETKDCRCSEFGPNIEFLNNVIVKELKYTKAILMTKFKFCPWCGVKLETIPPWEETTEVRIN